MRIVLICASAILAAACSKTAEAVPVDMTGEGAAAASDATAIKSPGKDFAIGPLKTAAIEKGECGMVLWTLEENQPAAIFKLTAGKGAEMTIDGVQTAFKIVESAGAAGFGVSENNTLAAGGYKTIVSVRFGLGFDGGAYLERGLITVEAASGWAVVVPVAGVAGCRSK